VLKSFESRLYCEIDWRPANSALAYSKTHHTVAEAMNWTLLLPRLNGDEKAMLKAVLESEPGWLPDVPATCGTSLVVSQAAIGRVRCRARRAGS
jgi:hypothetical protein